MGSKDFLGSGLKFPLQIDRRTGKIAMSLFEEDIEEAVRIIIQTSIGERVMRPEFGSNAVCTHENELQVAEYAFSPMAHNSKSAIAYDVQEQLVLQEPRIVDVEVETQEQDGNAGTLLIQVEYTVRNTNNRYNRVYPFYLNEGAEE